MTEIVTAIVFAYALGFWVAILCAKKIISGQKEEIKRLENGLMALSAYIGPKCTSRVLSAIQKEARA